MNPSRQIAIVGIGALFPGSTDVGQFWNHVRAGHDLAREVPAGRWALPTQQVYSKTPAPDRVYSTRGCFVDDFNFDPTGLNLSPALLAGLDPMFHLLLGAGQSAWNDAITGSIDPRRAGVIIGNIALPTDAISAFSEEILQVAWASRPCLPLRKNMGGTPMPPSKTNPLNRYVAGLPAGLLAKALGLGGGSYTLDAACASSLYALKLAVDELQSGRADLMLTGGLSRPDCLYTQMGFSQLRALSPSGRCSPFDGKADGLVVGEGAGILVLKRIADALRDGDKIYAMISGIGLSNDIGGNLMLPDSNGQLRAMRAAYAEARWNPHDVDLIECHGTGTPIGDAVEFNSLTQLWGSASSPQNRCVIGSVKSNVGHLLTAAGSAGLIKVLMAMRDNILPPTANFESLAGGMGVPPMSSSEEKHGRDAHATTPFKVLRQSAEWPRRSDFPRRAAVSAFGFGGINAHVLLEQWEPPASHSAVSLNGLTPPEISPPVIAIVGMAAHFGPWQSLEAFQHCVLGAGKPVAPTEPPHAWGHPGAKRYAGHFMESVDIPVGRFHIPPKELTDMLPQQLLMLQVAADAMDDANLAANPRERFDTGVFIGIALDLNTTNFHFRWKLRESDGSTDEILDAAGPPLTANRTMGALGGIVASRVARAFHIGGPSFTISNEECSGLRALEVGIRALQRGELNVSLVGAVDLAGDIRALLGQSAAQPALDIPLIGEGAAAVILKRHEDALRDGDRIYALIGGIGNIIAPSTQSSDAHQNLSAEADIGHAGAASGLASVVKAALALHHQILPTRNKGTSLPQYWLRDRIDGPRRARVFASSVDGNCLQVMMQSDESQAANRTISFPHSQPLGERNEALFTLSGSNVAELLADLDALQQFSKASSADVASALRTNSSPSRETVRSADPTKILQSLARDWSAQHPRSTPATCSLAIIARDVVQLNESILLARQHVQQGRAITGDRLFYNPKPLGPSAPIAFVFPGAGNPFPGMGRELAAQWPQVLHRLDAENDRLASQFALGQYWTDKPIGQISHRDAIFSQVWLGAMVSDLVRGFGVEPTAVIGYSLGESTGLFATRAWTSRDAMLDRMNASTLFKSDLAGDYDSVRRAWNLKPGEKVDWTVAVLDRPETQVRDALKNKSRVYLLIVNTPGECVIGGDRIAVKALARELGCRAHPLQGITSVHCEVAKPVEAAYRELHLFDTTPPPNIRFYSGTLGKSYNLTRESAADSIVGQAMQPFDFTRVIRSAYADGIRLFLEMGPGASCTRMIDQILQGQPHMARSACVAGQSETLSLLRMLAALISEGIAVNPVAWASRPCSSPLPPNLKNANPQSTPSDSTETHYVSVRVGGLPFIIPQPPRGTGFQPVLTSQQRDEIQISNSSPALSLQHHSEPHAPLDLPVSLLPLIEQMAASQSTHAKAQQSFLQLSQYNTAIMAEAISFKLALLNASAPEFVGSALRTVSPDRGNIPSGTGALTGGSPPGGPQPPVRAPAALITHPLRNIAFNRDLCLEYAIGSIAKVLGPDFALADTYPTRVRLPDEPLMLVDRIVSVTGQPGSMTHGRVVTEHDIHTKAWYLDGGRIPTCIAVEAGQADLFLSGYLGIDALTKGLAVYRLLDAVVTFHRPMPQAGETIVYDIAIDEFFFQGRTCLFRFHFDATVNGELLLTMRKGCAGFFTAAELAAGQGIVQTSLDQRPIPGKRPTDWIDPVPMKVESYTDAQISALRHGDLAACFGESFSQLNLRNPAGLPTGRMTLVHRILKLDPTAGRFGLGQIVGEADIHPDDWFLTCHFVDDRVMPGTLMYECCLHTLRIYLLRMGWVGEADEVVYEPIPGIASQLKCRGQVTQSTRKVQYEVTLKEIGYDSDGTPFALADALMYADGKPVVQTPNLSVKLTGLTREKIELVWQQVAWASRPCTSSENETTSAASQKPLFNLDRITAFAIGKPSDAFGDRYQVFDRERKIARLPGPPYQFLDRITSIQNCQPWQLAAGGVIEAEYDVPPDAWYFASNQQSARSEMPFAILLEVALQPCGWLAAYLGSALVSDVDMSFRNLGGSAVQSLAVLPDAGTLTTQIKITSVSNSGGMVIQHFDMAVRSRQGEVYRGNTYFGFFAKEALKTQVGIREAVVYQPTAAEIADGEQFDYPNHSPFPDRMMRMVDTVELFDPQGGPAGLGFIRGTTKVDPQAWFFKAHFFEDPVWPGSLGLESFLQLLKVIAWRRWGHRSSAQQTRFETLARGQKHTWVYRGQIIPADQQVTVQAVVTDIDDAGQLIRADGFLIVDRRVIYQMSDFAIKMICTA